MIQLNYSKGWNDKLSLYECKIWDTKQKLSYKRLPQFIFTNLEFLCFQNIYVLAHKIHKNRATQTCYTKIESLKPNKFDMFYVICHFEDKK